MDSHDAPKFGSFHQLKSPSFSCEFPSIESVNLPKSPPRGSPIWTGNNIFYENQQLNGARFQALASSPAYIPFDNVLRNKVTSHALPQAMSNQSSMPIPTIDTSVNHSTTKNLDLPSGFEMMTDAFQLRAWGKHYNNLLREEYNCHQDTRGQLSKSERDIIQLQGSLEQLRQINEKLSQKVMDQAALIARQEATNGDGLSLVNDNKRMQQRQILIERKLDVAVECIVSLVRSFAYGIGAPDSNTQQAISSLLTKNLIGVLLKNLEFVRPLDPRIESSYQGLFTRISIEIPSSDSHNATNLPPKRGASQPDQTIPSLPTLSNTIVTSPPRASLSLVNPSQSTTTLKGEGSPLK